MLPRIRIIIVGPVVEGLIVTVPRGGIRSAPSCSSVRRLPPAFLESAAACRKEVSSNGVPHFDPRLGRDGWPG